MTLLTIAVIDDDALVRGAMGALLRALGHQVRLHRGVGDFLTAGAGGVDCVICDDRMPGRSGLDLLEILRAEGLATPFILMTAFLSPMVEARARRLAATAVLDKPFDDDTLIAALAAAAPQG